MHANSVMLIGNLGDDPEIRSVGNNGDRVANLRIATTRSWRDGNGDRQERTEWHTVVAWRKWADKVESLSKGDKIIILGGEIQTRSWEDQDGKKRYSTEITVPAWPEGEIYKLEGLYDDDRGRGGGRDDRGGRSSRGGRDDDRRGDRDRGGRDDRDTRGRDDRRDADRGGGRDDRGTDRRDSGSTRPAGRTTARDLDDDVPF